LSMWSHSRGTGGSLVRPSRKQLHITEASRPIGGYLTLWS
jgi:hypothetical protein